MNDEGYKKLEIYQRSHRLAVEIHEISLKLPKYEMYEQGSQIRRSAKSIPANIVEGYCLRKHKNEFLLYLNRAFASSCETLEHLEILYETKSLSDGAIFNKLLSEYQELNKMIFSFIQSVSDIHEKPFYVKEDETPYEPNS